jgi:hypothetical protein
MNSSPALHEWRRSRPAAHHPQIDRIRGAIYLLAAMACRFILKAAKVHFSFLIRRT